jgi:hypothetical protein
MKKIAILGLVMLLCSGFTGIAAADGSMDITGAVGTCQQLLDTH